MTHCHRLTFGAAPDVEALPPLDLGMRGIEQALPFVELSQLVEQGRREVGGIVEANAEHDHVMKFDRQQCGQCSRAER